MKQRRIFFLVGLLFLLSGSPEIIQAQATGKIDTAGNLAIVAVATGSGRPGAILSTLNDGLTPMTPGTIRRQGPSPRLGVHWVEYDWSQPVNTRQIALFWWDYTRTFRLPVAYRIEYWDGNRFLSVNHVAGLGLRSGEFNLSTFDEINTSRLRVEMDSVDRYASTLLEWEVFESGHLSTVPPRVNAGVDRDVMADGKTYLTGQIRSVHPITRTDWTKTAGPGSVNFSTPSKPVAFATFSEPGEYTLTLTAWQGDLRSSSSLKVKVCPPPPASRLDVVYTKRYKIDSRLWSDRFKAMIVNWIPHCIDQINSTDLATGQGGIDNFIEAAKALKGLPHEASTRGMCFPMPGYTKPWRRYVKP